MPCAVPQAGTLADKRIVVAIDSWEADSLYPSGHYVRTLGAIGDKETETEVRREPAATSRAEHAGEARAGGSHPVTGDRQACRRAAFLPGMPPTTRRFSSPLRTLSSAQVLLIENDINTSPFTAAVHACVPPLPWRVTEADTSDPQRAGTWGGVGWWWWWWWWGGWVGVVVVVGGGTQQPTGTFQPPPHTPRAAAALGAAPLHQLAAAGAPSAPPSVPVPLPLRLSADLRHLPVCSVDPPGCKDIDDALHVRRLPNGNFELGGWVVLGGGGAPLLPVGSCGCLRVWMLACGRSQAQAGGRAVGQACWLACRAQHLPTRPSHHRASLPLVQECTLPT